MQIDLTHPLEISQAAWAAGIPVLAGFLVLLRKRHPHLDTRAWLLALFFLFCTEFGWVHPEWSELHHTLFLVGQLLAGVALSSYKHDRGAEGPDAPFVVLNALPLVLFEGFYGFYVLKPWIFYSICVGAMVVLAATTYWRRRGIGFAVWASLGWMALAGLVWLGTLRCAAYFALAAVYGYAAFRFARKLPRGSVGRVAMVGSMLVWVFSFVTHPWVFYHPGLFTISGSIWELQKPLSAIAMLLVLLEDEAAGSKWLAMHDPMTKIPNRRCLEQWLGEHVGLAAHGRGGLALLRVDVNGMQEVNDQMGYQARDQAITTVAERLVKMVKPGREMVARLDGSEFVVASMEVWDDDAMKALEERTLEAVGRPFSIGERGMMLTGSLGAAVYPFDVVGVPMDRVGEFLLETASRNLNENRHRQVQENRGGRAISEKAALGLTTIREKVTVLDRARVG